MEKALPKDHHHHTHGHDDMAKVNATTAENSLELAAAEDSTDKLSDEKESIRSEDGVSASSRKEL